MGFAHKAIIAMCIGRDMDAAMDFWTEAALPCLYVVLLADPARHLAAADAFMQQLVLPYIGTSSTSSSAFLLHGRKIKMQRAAQIPHGRL